jgi:hypothetical protein
MKRSAQNVVELGTAKEKVEREAQRSFTSWKLDVLNALASDPEVSAGHFRIAFRVMQAVNRETRVAFISDELLCDEVPSTDRWKCNKARRKLIERDWWTVDRGHGGKASRYIFLDTNLNAILDRLAIYRDARATRRRKRRQEDRRRKRGKEGRGENTT